MKEQNDKSFIKSVSIVMAILVVFTFSIAFFARDIGFLSNEGNNPSRDLTSKERIKRVADVYTSEAGIAAVQATATPPPKAAAFDGSLDGKMIYTRVCSACHMTGAAGAPKPGTAAMAERAEKGLDALMQSSLNGLNAMPPRGGRADLSDEQVRAVVEFMLQ